MGFLPCNDVLEIKTLFHIFHLFGNTFVTFLPFYSLFSPFIPYLQIDDYQEGEEPTEDDELRGAVAQDDFCGVATLFIDNSDLDVA